MKILFAASEVTPIVKVGGLADVVGSLPKALLRLGHDVRVIIPFYGAIDRQAISASLVWKNLMAQFEGKSWLLNIYETRLPGSDAPLYLLDCPAYFGSDGIYSMSQDPTALGDGLKRFVAFSSFVSQVLPQLDWQPEVIHCHDWHTGLLPAALAKSQAPYRTVLTIHNLHNQGVWNATEVFSWLAWSGHEHPLLELRDERGDLNLLQIGIHAAGAVNTVSPTYATEILTAEFGEGLHDDLAEHRPAISGILNGLDTDLFDPAHDHFIYQPFTADTVAEGKGSNKLALQKDLGFTPNPTAPLFVSVSRLSPQKGLDLLPEITDRIARAGGQVAILGSGWPEIEGQLHRLVDAHPRSVQLRLGFDATLAQRMYAAADFFLMPSRFEPCGLGQLISMRYGTLPVVRDTGGLRDTVIDAVRLPHQGTGFVFSKFSIEDFRVAVDSALRIYRRPATLQAIRRRAMSQDFSWATSANAYVRLYGQTTQYTA